MTPLSCESARAQLQAYVDGELNSLQAAALERHLESCGTCKSALDEARALREAVRARAPYHRAPEGLLARLTAQTSGQRPVTASNSIPASSTARRRAWQRWSLPLAASLAIAVAVDSGLQWRRAGDRLAGEVLDAHVRSLMADHLADVPSTDQHTVKPWFADKLDFSPPVRDLAGDGFPLSGGRLDFIDHHPAAALVYRHRLHVINVFVWPATEDSILTPATQTRDGFNLVHWRSGGMELWAVSDLNVGELNQFARLLLPGAS